MACRTQSITRRNTTSLIANLKIVQDSEDSTKKFLTFLLRLAFTGTKTASDERLHVPSLWISLLHPLSPTLPFHPLRPATSLIYVPRGKVHHHVPERRARLTNNLPLAHAFHFLWRPLGIFIVKYSLPIITEIGAKAVDYRDLIPPPSST